MKVEYNFVLVVAAGSLLSALAVPSLANQDSVSSSLMATSAPPPPAKPDENPHALRSASMFALIPPKPRVYEEHDLVQIIVRETSEAKSSQDLETKKKSKIEAAINAWPDIQLEDLLEFQMYAGRTDNLPALDVEANNDFKGEGDYERKDDLSARLTAEIIEVLPNGNLVLEARTCIRTDKEEQMMKVTGVCRPTDVSPANTVLSNQIHDLMIEKIHKGELREAGKKGIISKALETVFAF